MTHLLVLLDRLFSHASGKKRDSHSAGHSTFSPVTGKQKRCAKKIPFIHYTLPHSMIFKCVLMSMYTLNVKCVIFGTSLFLEVLLFSGSGE
jgi:hypothetical protein